MCTSCETPRRWMLQNTFNAKAILVKVMAWCCQATNHYLSHVDPYLCHHMVSLGNNELTDHVELALAGTDIDFHSLIWNLQTIHHAKIQSYNLTFSHYDFKTVVSYAELHVLVSSQVSNPSYKIHPDQGPGNQQDLSSENKLNIHINGLLQKTYRQISNIICTLLGSKIVYHSDVIGASPVGAAPTTSSFPT